MPYIKSKRRSALNDDSRPANVGELTYVICKVVDDYLRDKSRSGGLRYQYLAEVAGALANTQMEINRRVTAMYEHNKMHENGDMFFILKDYQKESIPNE